MDYISDFVFTVRTNHVHMYNRLMHKQHRIRIDSMSDEYLYNIIGSTGADRCYYQNNRYEYRGNYVYECNTVALNHKLHIEMDTKIDEYRGPVLKLVLLNVYNVYVKHGLELLRRIITDTFDVFTSLNRCQRCIISLYDIATRNSKEFKHVDDVITYITN